MCGLTGFWRPRGFGADSDAQLRRMTHAIRHRGPDDDGHWMDPAAGIALGHRRLSILDLSPEGHQPMHSAAGRYVIAFNGEIYNFAELRDELAAKGVRFRGRSDTEVLLEGIATWGLEEMLQRAAGMFALALWDRERRRLFLARDRFGEKPLYFGWQGDTLLFGSELKALRAHAAFNAPVDRVAVTNLMRFNYIPAPRSIYEGIGKLLPGHLAELDAERHVIARAYWSLAEVAERGLSDPLSGSPRELADQLEERLRATIREQMVADVPLGALLSGGVDSTSVVALMQAESNRAVRTFTIGFREPGYNEAEHAMAVARHLGTEHTELYVSPDEARLVIPLLPTLYDEPFADSSQVPTFLVSQMARRDVTVALSGDGADELFGGYNRYLLGRRIWSRVSPLPHRVRGALSRVVHAVPAARWQGMLGTMQAVLPQGRRVAHIGDRIHKLADVLAVETDHQLYRSLISHWREPASLVLGGSEPAGLLDTVSAELPGASFVERMMYVDARTYLPDDILVKVDRASMGVSLECRAPFLDHRVAELAWRMPLSAKVSNGQGKRVLRDVLYRHVPQSLVERPKMGFGVPIDTWLRGPLREWAADLLSPERLHRDGMFHEPSVTQKWREHQQGSRNWQYLLWDVLMYQAWADSLS
jgi:asparagine synthase (glutamine-hydrolysing)